MPPDAANRTGEDPDRVVPKLLDCGGIVPNLYDIPYLTADAYLEGPFQPKDGTPFRDVSATGPAKWSYWDPTPQERLCIAAGGMIQILSLTKQQPPLIVNGLFVNRQVAMRPVLVAMARHLMARLNGSDLWDQTKPEEQEEWLRAMGDCTRIMDYWAEQIAKGHILPQDPPEEPEEPSR